MHHQYSSIIVFGERGAKEEVGKVRLLAREAFSSVPRRSRETLHEKKCTGESGELFSPLGVILGVRKGETPARWESEQLQVACQSARLRATLHLELAIEILDVGFHGIEGNDQFLRNFLIRKALGQQT
jgi:hypothetical protein